jgi:hypothetical protein
MFFLTCVLVMILEPFPPIPNFSELSNYQNVETGNEEEGNYTNDGAVENVIETPEFVLL